MIFKNWILVSAILAVFLFPIAFPLMIDDNPTLKASSQISSNSADKINSLSGSDDLNTASPRYSVASEEEDIDDFTVSPESGRWETTTTGAVDSRIIEGNLRTITTENTTSSSSEYFMQRGLQSSDDKIDYRYKATMDNQSQVEYFRDVLGDSADFEESDVEGFSNSGVTISQSNGNLIIEGSATSGIYAINQFASQISFKVFTGHEFRIKSNYSMNVLIRYGQTDFSSNRKFETYGLTTEFQTFSESFDTFSASSTDDWFDEVRFQSDSSATAPFKWTIDYLDIKGDLDYATHDSSIGDSWDFDDSNEYFTDSVLANTSDFNDGTTENWVQGSFDNAGGALTNSGSEYLLITATVNDDSLAIEQESLSITATGASGYDYLTFEFMAEVAINIITIDDVDNNIVCTSSTGWTADAWHLFTCDLDLDTDWTGTETGLQFIFYYGAKWEISDTLLLNMIYLYDQALGDLEDYSSTQFSYVYVNPEGYLQTSFASAGSSGRYVRTNTIRYIDYNVFDTITIRAKGEQSSIMRITDSGITQGFVDFVFSATDVFQIFTYQVSLDSNWDDNLGILGILFYDSSYSTFEGNERFTIDYILLEASTEQEQEFTLGFWDQDNNQALANITHHFFNSTTFRWEIELYDSNQEIASYYYSANQTVSDIYYRGSISYNWLQAEFDIKMNFDNGTRVFSADLFDDFTINNQFPAVFSFGKIPDFFISTYTVYYGHQENWIDYITAPFKKRDWKQVTTSSNTNLGQQSPNLAVLQGIASGSNQFEIEFQQTVSYLDFVSGTLITNVSDLSSFTNGISRIEFSVFSIDWDTGDSNLLVIVGMALGIVGPNIIYEGYFEDNTATKYEFYTGITTSAYQSMDFSISVLDERNSLDVKAIYAVPDSAGWDQERRIISNVSIGDISSKASQEFLLSIKYIMEDDLANANVQWLGELIGFDFIQKELWADVGNAIGGLFGWVADIGGDFVGGLISAFATIITSILLPLILWIGSIVVSVGTFFANAIIDSLGPLLSSIISAVAGVAGPIVSAIGGVAAAVGTAIWSSLTTVLGGLFDDIITLIVSALTDLWNDILLPIVNLFLGVLDVVITAILGVASTLLDGLLDLIPFGIGDWVRSFTTIDLTNPIGGFFDIVAFLLGLASFGVVLVALATTAYIFFIPFVNDRDIWDNASVMMSNAFHMHGFDWNTGLGNLTIPVRFNMVLVWIILIALLGWISYILPFSLW